MADIYRLPSKEVLERRQAMLDAQWERLVEVEKKYGAEDQFKDGDVITFNYRFTNGTVTYKYAGLFVKGRWYLTGPQIAGTPLTWHQVIAFWERGKMTKLQKVTKRQRIV